MQRDYLPLYPPVRLDHLERLTDDTGIIQHALHSVPDPLHGYSIDDQARALIVVLAHANQSGHQRAPRAAYTYMSFLRNATTDGAFHNFLSYSRDWLDEKGSADSHGRALWALGYTTRFGIERGLAEAAAELFDSAITLAKAFEWPRAWAFTLFGLYHRYRASNDAALVQLAHYLAARLVSCFEEVAETNWLWFESQLTYCNAKLPAALLLAYEVTGERKYRDVGLAGLTWLRTVLLNEAGELRLVGQRGWYPRNGIKASFDEQCVDAQGFVEASLIAARVTGDTQWHHDAIKAFNWFIGRNVHGLSLIDSVTWGCFDGITESRLNRNMGAESIVCYLLAYLELVRDGLLTLEGAVPQPE
jgi:hypothetical protein